MISIQPHNFSSYMVGQQEYGLKHFFTCSSLLLASLISSMNFFIFRTAPAILTLNKTQMNRYNNVIARYSFF